MAKRKSFNRRRNSSRKSIDSIGSGHLDPDTSIIDEEQTFWWNHLQENTFTPHSLIHSGNETSKQLSVNSRINSSQSPQQWWKNLDSDNEPVASASKRHSAALVKRNIVVQTSTSESEKELNLRKKKVRLKANSRKSINNAFANALNDTEVTGPLKLRMKRANYSNLHSDSNRKSLQKKSQEDEEDSNSSSTEKILKSKPSISRKRRSKSIEDQNAFQDILTEDNVLNNSTAKQCLKQCFVALEKKSSKRLMHRNIDTSKDHINDQRKSIRASQIMPLENIGTGFLLSNVDKAMPGNNVNEVVQSSDKSVIDHQRLKFKSRFMQRTRKSVGNNAFADALADNASLSTSNPNKENSIYISPILQSLLSPLKKSINKSKTVDVMPENSSVRKSPRLSLRTQSETLKSSNKNVEVSKRSTIADIEEDNNVNIDLEISSDDVVHTITREHIHSKDNTNIRTHKNTILSIEMETIDDEDAESARQTIQQNFPSKPGTNSEAVNRQSMQSLNRTSIKDNREIARRQTSLSKPQNYRNTPIKSKGKDISSSKQNSFKTLTKINDFFKIKETSVKQLSERAQKSQIFDNEKMEEIKIEMEKIKSREMAVMKINSTDNKESALKIKNVKSVIPKQTTKKKPPTFIKVVNKAFLVNGKIYKPPRLPRPKNWATDRLYKFLWNRMEPKYKLATRVKSEKFVQDLAKIVTIIEHRKNYENYKLELKALMKQMARLKIINTRANFYHFCQDFLPYEFRIKVIPMLLPGNKSNIPYDPENVHTPLLDTE